MAPSHGAKSLVRNDDRRQCLRGQGRGSEEKGTQDAQKTQKGPGVGRGTKRRSTMTTKEACQSVMSLALSSIRFSNGTYCAEYCAVVGGKSLFSAHGLLSWCAAFHRSIVLEGGTSGGLCRSLLRWRLRKFTSDTRERERFRHHSQERGKKGFGKFLSLTARKRRIAGIIRGKCAPEWVR